MEETARDEEYRQTQVQNVEEVVVGWFANPGARAVWEANRQVFPLLIETFEAGLAKADKSDTLSPEQSEI